MDVKSSWEAKHRTYISEDLNEFTDELFDPVILDTKGETYKDKIKTLVRFIGKRKKIL